MKKFLILLATVTLIAAAVQGNRLMKLGWNENAPEDAVAFYTVRITGPISTNVEIAQPPIELTNLLGGFPNGEYTITLTATGLSAIESDPSSPLVVFWYGNKPSAPTNLVVIFP
jgi:hypothetical protein